MKLDLKKIFSFRYIWQKKMQAFYIERKPRLNQERIVHRENCDLLPVEEGRVNLGRTSDFQAAVLKARNIYPRVKGCKYCSVNDKELY